MSLLAYLAVARDAIPRKRVAFLLWPDTDEESALANLRRHLALLDQTLPATKEPWIRKGRTTVQWSADAPSAVDAVQFEAMSGNPERFAQAVDLYAGDFLETIEDEWVGAHRERLRDKQMTMLQHLCEAARQRADMRTALEYAERAYRLDPWREDIVREIIDLHGAQGDVAGSVRVYQTFERRVLDELGVPPMPETTQTLEALVARQTATPKRQAPVSAAVPPTPTRTEEPPSNLPRELNTFVGREAIVAELRELMHRSPLVTVVGTGGVGKSRTALHIAGEVIRGYADGVWFVELASVKDPGLVAGTVAMTLGVAEATERPILDALVDHLRPRRSLIVLDNCEHVITGAAEVAAKIVRECRRATLLATSRESLSIAGEQVYRLPSLAVPPVTVRSAAETLAYDAATLFVERATQANSRFRIADENAGVIGEICRRLDGLPLAIELAAARMKAMSPQQLAARIDDRFRVLTSEDRLALPRMRTMRALIDWSHDLLSTREQMLFRRLSIFAKDWTLDAAHKVCSGNDFGSVDSVDIICSLVNKSLVVSELGDDGNRYGLLESVRQYARERLFDAEEEDELAHRHARWARAFAEAANVAYLAVPTLEWNAHVGPELEELLAAVSWTLGDRADTGLGLALVGALRWAWILFTPHDGRRWIEIALAAVDSSTPLDVTAQLWLTQAHLAHFFHAFRESVAATEHAATAYRALGDRGGVAEAQRFEGHSRALLGDVEHGERLLAESLRTFEDLGQVRLAGRCMNYQAIVRDRLGDLDGARKLYRRTLAISEAHADEHMRSLAASNLAKLDFHAGDVESALRLNESVLATKRARKDALGIALDLCNRAAYLLALRRFDDARLTAREALQAAHNVHSPVHVAWAMQHLAAVAFNDGEDRRAAQLLGYVERLFRASEVKRDDMEERDYQRLLSGVRRRLDDDEYEALRAAGATWNEEQAAREACAVGGDAAGEQHHMATNGRGAAR